MARCQQTQTFFTLSSHSVIRQVEICRTRPIQHSDTTSDVLATAVSTANKTSPARTWQPPERSHEQRTIVLKCWNCEEAQSQSNYKDCSCGKRSRSNAGGSIPIPKTRWTQHGLRTRYLSTVAAVEAAPNLEVTSTNYQTQSI